MNITTTTPREEARLSIAALDQTVLALLREGWLDATDDTKPKWMARINTALDERLRLMRIRNDQPQPV